MTDQPLTDTPVSARTFPPPSRSDAAKAFIGDLARPLVLIAGGISAAIATVIVALKVESSDAAAFTAAVGGALALLYGAKAWENSQAAKASANVEVAKAQAGAVQ